MMPAPSPTASAPPPPPAAPMTGGMSEVCVPTALLTIGTDESDSAPTVAPAVGDPVEFSATGTVTRVEGENSYLTLESVNGQPLPPPAGAPAEPTADDMRALGAEADQEEMPA